MKKILLVALFTIMGCISTGAVKEPASTVNRECIELTDEVKAERARHEQQLDALKEFMDVEVFRLQEFMLAQTGQDIIIQTHDTNFVHDYALATVYASGHQDGEHVVDLYFVVANPPGGSLEVIGLFIREPKVLQDLKKELDRLLDDMMHMQQEQQPEGEEI